MRRNMDRKQKIYKDESETNRKKLADFFRGEELDDDTFNNKLFDKMKIKI
jgi:hypothetical protein